LPSWLFLGQACYSTWEVYSLGIFRIFFKRMSSRWLNHSFEKYWSNWIKLDHFLKDRGKNRKMFETTT